MRRLRVPVVAGINETSESWIGPWAGVASRWLRALDLGDYAIVDNPDGSFTIDDKLGARARCTRALDQDGVLVVIARGVLDVSSLPTINGTGVILVRYSPAKG